MTSIPVPETSDVSEFREMDCRLELTNGIISSRIDRIRAPVRDRRAQRFPTRGTLGGTLTLSRFSGKYTQVLFRVIFVIHLRINALAGGLRDHARELPAAS
jgi:hypothetical protein